MCLYKHIQNTPTGPHTKSKCLTTQIKGHVYLVKLWYLRKCAVLSNHLEPWRQGTCRRTSYASYQVCMHGHVSPTHFVENETQPVDFASQYKTRYPISLAGQTFWGNVWSVRPGFCERRQHFGAPS